VSTIRVALAQVNPVVGDLDENRRLIEAGIDQARGKGADIVAFPELVVNGYPPEDLVLRKSFVEDGIAVLETIASNTHGIAAIVGFIDRGESKPYNAAAIIADGEIRGVYHKHRLPNYGVFDEERYFARGEGLLLGKIGDLIFGVTICEDIWSADGPHSACAASGACLVININGSPYHRGKGTERLALLRRRARESGAAVAYVNMVGGQDELVFDGQSMVVGEIGDLVARAAQFEEELLVFDFEPWLKDPVQRGPASEALRVVSLGDRTEAKALIAERVADPMEEDEEVYRALVLGVSDYLGKNGFTEALIGLSGGIDSSLTAAIASDAIGPENVTGILMPSRFTSDESLDYGKRVASNLGIKMELLSISDIQKTFKEVLDPVLGDAFVGVAEENLQPRIRGTLLMAISNSRPGSILLSTGNKSELATGYATLYGDMAGGFAVLKDVPKTLVYRLSAWRNREREVIPREVIERPPTAELKADQLDTDKLPPYDLLDPILEAYVEDDRSVDEIAEMGFDDEIVRGVARMVDFAEYKRRQAPPGIKITERAFGRDRRLPITNRYRRFEP
jgi:NAD+ synthase (glutamine-hydrolysing)